MSNGNGLLDPDRFPDTQKMLAFDPSPPDIFPPPPSESGIRHAELLAPQDNPALGLWNVLKFTALNIYEGEFNDAVIGLGIEFIEGLEDRVRDPVLDLYEILKRDTVAQIDKQIFLAEQELKNLVAAQFPNPFRAGLPTRNLESWRVITLRDATIISRAQALLTFGIMFGMFREFGFARNISLDVFGEVTRRLLLLQEMFTLGTPNALFAATLPQDSQRVGGTRKGQHRLNLRKGKDR